MSGLALLLAVQLTAGQLVDPPPAAPAERPRSAFATLEAWNRHRLGMNRLTMVVLGSWAVANIGYGAVAGILHDDRQWRAFHLTNGAWNVANLVIALISFFGEHAADPRSFDARQSLEKAHGMEKSLLLNLGLDAAYLVAGAFFWQRGSQGTPELVGVGQALLLQGAFLAAFDALLYALNSSLTQDLLMNLQITHTGGAVASVGARF